MLKIATKVLKHFLKHEVHSRSYNYLKLVTFSSQSTYRVKASITFQHNLLGYINIFINSLPGFHKHQRFFNPLDAMHI